MHSLKAMVLLVPSVMEAIVTIGPTMASSLKTPNGVDHARLNGPVRTAVARRSLIPGSRRQIVAESTPDGRLRSDGRHGRQVPGDLGVGIARAPQRGDPNAGKRDVRGVRRVLISVLYEFQRAALLVVGKHSYKNADEICPEHIGTAIASGGSSRWRSRS